MDQGGENRKHWLDEIHIDEEIIEEYKKNLDSFIYFPENNFHQKWKEKQEMNDKQKT